MRNKIVNRFNIQTIAGCIFLTALMAQTGLKVVRKYSIYKQLVRADSSKRMVELKSVEAGIQYDLRYATTNNFMRKRLYKTGSITFLRLPAAIAIAQVERELVESGLSLKVWDAYRPYGVTVKMWQPIRDERYVADPQKGSGHNRGIAIDLTLIQKTTGKELNMGTDFDNFSDTAHPGFTNLPAEVLHNRSLLKLVMEKYGFRELETEWWHFYWQRSDFELLDIDPEKFRKNLN